MGEQIGAAAEEQEGPPIDLARVIIAGMLFASWCGPDRTSDMAKDYASKAFDRADDFISVAAKKGVLAMFDANEP